MTEESNAPEKLKSPDERLADEIVDALLEAKLVDASKAKSLRQSLAVGGVKQDDWRGVVEFKKSAPDKNATGAEDESNG